MSEVMAWLFISCGFLLGSFCFLILDRHFKRFIKPMQADLHEQIRNFVEYKRVTDARFSFEEAQIKKHMLTPQPGKTQQEVNDTMVMLDRQHFELEQKFKAFTESESEKLRVFVDNIRRDHWSLVKDTHERLKKMEGKVEQLSPIHIHWHKDTSQRKLKPLIPKEKADTRSFFDPNPGTPGV